MYSLHCSPRVLEENVDKYRCLHNIPQQLVGGGPVCGNAVVEDGEECDCGSVEDCPLLDPCCEVGTCQLKNTSDCFTGPCCDEQVCINHNKWEYLEVNLNRPDLQNMSDVIVM